MPYDFAGPDNADRAGYADTVLDALAALAEGCVWPRSEAASARTMASFARVALAVYAAQTRHYAVDLPGNPPSPDATDDHTAAYAEDLDEAAEITADFLGDLRHLLDRHGLTADAVCAAPPTHDLDDHTATVHVLAALAITGLNFYTSTVGLNFAELDERGAWHYRQEVADELEDQAAEIAAASTDDIGRAAQALAQQDPDTNPHQ